MNYKEQLEQQWYANVPYPETLHQKVRAANNAWVKFCALPITVKNGLGFSNYGGYEEKNPGNHHDHKELFHFTLSEVTMFNDYAASLDSKDAAILNDLTEKSAAIVEGAKEIIVDFLNDCSDAMTDPESVQTCLDASDTWVIRFLHYYPTDSLDLPTADPHCDIGGFTLHLFQDYPGLEYYDGANWYPVDLSNDVTSILPAMGMQYRTEGKIKATCHRVVPTLESQKTGRHSAVMFCGWKSNGRWDKEKYGSLGKQEPGFNYTMSHQELAERFTFDKDLSSV